MLRWHFSVLFSWISFAFERVFAEVIDMDVNSLYNSYWLKVNNYWRRRWELARPVKKQPEQWKKEILDAAKELFLSKGYEETAMIIPESCSLVIPLASRAFLIASPIGVKSKSKWLFLSSISSPPILWKSYPYILQRCGFQLNEVKFLTIGNIISCHKR